MSNDFTFQEFRALTLEEFRLLEWLLAHGTAEAANYVAQLPRASVVARCTCGCPTLDLALDGKKSRTVGVSKILAKAEGRSPEGTPVYVMLHAREEELSELEVVSVDETKIFSLPTPEMLGMV
ncbi:MAG TPA: hypothetical protein VD835_03560 [Pyrinomonadaceae bacterium]|nr:hypothetical protein [Pyrinomonadaceae bacterium]